MKIYEVIEKIKKYSRGIGEDGKKIDDEKTRDHVLYGTTDKECTGIVTTCFASVDVIKKSSRTWGKSDYSTRSTFLESWRSSGLAAGRKEQCLSQKKRTS